MSKEVDEQIEIVGDELTGFSATLPTGQVYKGKTKDELLHEVVKAQVNSSMTLQEKERQLADSRRIMEDTEKQRQKEQREHKQQANNNGEPVFDEEAFNTRYWELINTQPLKAMEYAMQHYFGIDNPREAFQKSTIVSEFVSDAVATREFLRDNRDFPATPSNGEKVLEEALSRGLEITSYNLERVWKDMKREGTITPLTQEQIMAEEATLKGNQHQDVASEVGAPSPTKRRQPPPTPGSGTREDTERAGQIGDEQLNKFASMNKADRERILRERGLL